MTARKPRPVIDLANPPTGMRLNLAEVMAVLCVGVRQLAIAAKVSPSAAFRLLHNDWPARANEHDRTDMRAGIEQLLLARGAMPSQMATLWHADPQAMPDRPVRGPQAWKFNNQASAANSAPADPAPEEDSDMLLPKQTLEPQTRRHFKLASNPFDGEVTRDEQMFNGDDIRYVRETAWQCCVTGGFVAIVGESGAGKTTIQADLEERIANGSEPITVIKPSILGMAQSERQGSQLRSADILHAIISTLAPQRSVPQGEQARKVAAHKLLATSAQLGNHHLLVIEEAHSMPDAALKHLKRLHEIRNGRRPLLGILLLAQPELKQRLVDGLREGNLREVAQRCEVVQLLPLDGDLRAYLQCRAAAAGVALDSLIDAGGVEALRERLTVKKTGQKPYSICYPLAVHNLLTKCLNRAAEIGMPVVNEDLVMKA